MQIRYKLVTLFLVIILPLLFVPVFLYNSIHSRIQNTEHILSHDLSVQQSLNDIENSLIEMESAVRGYLISHDKEDIENYTRAQNTYSVSIERLKYQMQNSRIDASRILTIDQKVKQWTARAAEPIINTSAQLAPTTSEEYINLDRQYMPATITGVRDLKSLHAEGVFKRQGDIEILADSFQRIIIITVSLVFAGFALFLILVMRVYLNPINKLIDVVRTFTQGDLSKRAVVDSTDELGELSGSFNTMITMLQRSQTELEKRVQSRTTELAIRMREIEHEKSKNEALLANIGEGIVATLVSGSILFVNKAAREMLKIESKDALSKHFDEVIVIQDEKGNLVTKEKHPVYTVAQTGKKLSSTLNSSYYFVRKDGTRFPVVLTATPLIFAGKPVGTIIIFRDFTKEKQIDMTKNEFVSLASHQLRTPLSIVNWYSEMMYTGDAGVLTDLQKKYVNEIYHANTRMLELVGALLNVSRLDLGTFLMEPQKTNIVEIAQSALAELTPIVIQKRLIIKELYDAQLPPILIDRKIAFIIFQNLLTNAAKYTPESGMITIEITHLKNWGSLQIRITDTGFGIPKDQQTKIFTKLFRAENVRTRDTEGTGLGLYLVKSVVEKIGGKIWFVSPVEKGTGTEFIVTIPLNHS